MPVNHLKFPEVGEQMFRFLFFFFSCDIPIVLFFHLVLRYGEVLVQES